MPVSQAHKKATQKYEKNNYFKTLIRFKKEDESRIRAAAGDSLNGFIVSAVLEKVAETERKQATAQGLDSSGDCGECPF